MNKIVQTINHYELVTSEGFVEISKKEFENYKNSGKLKIPYIIDDYKLIYEIKE